MFKGKDRDQNFIQDATPDHRSSHTIAEAVTGWVTVAQAWNLAADAPSSLVPPTVKKFLEGNLKEASAYITWMAKVDKATH